MSSIITEGLNFPVLEQNERSTTLFSKKLFATCFNETGDSITANSIIGEKNWRYNYKKYLMKHVQESLKNPQIALKSAECGLNFLHENFDFIRDGKTMKFNEAMKFFNNNKFYNGFIKGNKPKPERFEFVVSYKGRKLRGEELKKQLEKWKNYGTIESDTAETIKKVIENPNWIDLSDQYFVLLGAGSAMGPYSVLLELGANIIAIDLDREHIWKRLINIAEQSCGTLTFPLKKAQNEISSKQELYQQAGSNLITHAPEIYTWIKQLYLDKPLTIGCYVYLDGEAHVKVSLACDAIMKGLSENRKNVSLAFLCTPTDIHVIPEEANQAQNKNYSEFHWKQLFLFPIHLFAGSKYLVKNALPPIIADDGSKFYIVDGLTIQQGPNYALAKRMQHWRAIIARSKKIKVSSHIAPSTSTVSVVHNKKFAWAYDGMPFFKPIEIFEQETSNSVMSAILINDIRNPNSVANPEFSLKNPLEMFKYNSFHGGIWRAAYKVGSIGEVSVIIHFIKILLKNFFILFVIVILAILLQKVKKLF